MSLRPPGHDFAWAVLAACRIMIPAYFGMIVAQVAIGLGVVIGVGIGELIH